MIHTRCQRCKFCAGKNDNAHLQNSCDYLMIARKSRVAQIYTLLGVKTLTPYARWLLDPQHCIFFEPGKRRKPRRERIPVRV